MKEKVAMRKCRVKMKDVFRKVRIYTQWERGNGLERFYPGKWQLSQTFKDGYDWLIYSHTYYLT